MREFISSPRLYWFAKTIYQALYRRGLLVGTSSPEELQGAMPTDYAKRMSGFQQRRLNQRLQNTAIQTHRRQLKLVYDQAVAAAGYAPVTVPEYADPVLLRYPVRVREKAAVLAEARRRWIELGDWYRQPVDPPGESCDDSFGYIVGMCPEGERASREVINLPMNMGIGERQAEKIVRFVKEVA
jgi:dTDP-4-amino-4,6-dideoxygalactose transaminase